MQNLFPAVALAIIATPAVASGISVTNAWVRLPAVPTRPAAAYLTIMGTAKPQMLIGVSSPSAKSAQFHESSMTGGSVRMASHSKLTIGTNAMVVFEPGGKHVMLFGLDPSIKPGGTIRIDLKLANGTTTSFNAKAVGVADPSPFGTEGAQHHHR